MPGSRRPPGWPSRNRGPWYGNASRLRRARPPRPGCRAEAALEASIAHEAPYHPPAAAGRPREGRGPPRAGRPPAGLQRLGGAPEAPGGLDRVLGSGAIEADVLVVDDGSTQPFDPSGLGHDFRAIRRVEVLHLRRNLGHQRAIAIGLAFVEAERPRLPGRRPDGLRRRGRPRGRPPPDRPTTSRRAAARSSSPSGPSGPRPGSSGPSTSSTGWPTGS